MRAHGTTDASCRMPEGWSNQGAHGQSLAARRPWLTCEGRSPLSQRRSVSNRSAAAGLRRCAGIVPKTHAEALVKYPAVDTEREHRTVLDLGVYRVDDGPLD